MSVLARLGAAALIARASTTAAVTQRHLAAPAVPRSISMLAMVLIVDVLIVVVLHTSIPRHPWFGWVKPSARSVLLLSRRQHRPAAARRRPRLLYLHGYLQPETFVEEFALLTTMALQLDVEIIQMQPPYHGRRAPRASRFSSEFYWTADLVRSFEALRQTLLDARTLLGWLLAKDVRPVGVAGLSLGGALTLSLACLEERFAVAVPLVAHVDLAALVSDAPVLTTMRHDLKSFGWRKKQFDDFIRGVGWYELRPKLPADRVLMIAASEDRFFDPRLVRQLWRHWGKPAIHWYPTSHMGFLTHLPEVLSVMREFIDRRAIE